MADLNNIVDPTVVIDLGESGVNFHGKPEQEITDTVTVNGTKNYYPETGYVISKATITTDVHPSESLTETITTNGVHNYTGEWKNASITVNAAKPEESLEATITANGTRTFNPRSGYAFSEATIITNVHPSASLSETYTTNGTKTVSGEFNGGTIVVNVPEQKPEEVLSQTITSNSTYSFSPQSGYAFSRADIIVNVDSAKPEETFSVVPTNSSQTILPTTGHVFSYGTVSGYDVDEIYSSITNLNIGTPVAPTDYSPLVDGTITSINCNASIIRNYAFYNYTSLVSATFPQCSYIGSSAFTGCYNLESVSFPQCTSIGGNAFQWCSNLYNIYAPNCSYVGRSAFTYAYSLSSNGVYYSPDYRWCLDGFSYASGNISLQSECTLIAEKGFASGWGSNSKYLSIFGENVKYINSCAFNSCTGLTTIDFPQCTRIDYQTFKDCFSLSSINFPQCTRIENEALYGCSSLVSANFPQCSHIGEGAFQNCYSLSSISFPQCTRIEGLAFGGCASLVSVDFPQCTYIGSYGYVFASCYNLESVSFPNCTNIVYYAFQYCSSLQSVSFPKCSNIGNAAFQYCSSLQSVSFPQCNYIDYAAFQNCSNLSEITIGTELSTRCSIYGSNAFEGTQITSTTGSIYVPASLITQYQSATNWAYFSTQFVGV